MFSYNIKFLTCDEFVHLKYGDFKSYKYETKKKAEESVYERGKRSFCERRGGHWAAVNPRQIKQLEAKFRERTAVFCDWLNDCLIVIVFSSGAIAYLTVKPNTLDVIQILFDRYVVGKLSGQTVSGVAYCKSHLLFTHTDRTATLVTFGKNSSSSQPCRMRDRDPHIQAVELGGSRRTERKVSWCNNSSGARVLVWGAAALEPAPWSPVLEDHANMHLYQLKGQQMSLIAYHQLENETLSAEISQNNDNVIHIVEQITCHQNGVSLEWVRYELPAVEMRATKLSSVREASAAASLPAPARAVRRARCDSRLLVACIDGSLHVVHAAAGLTHSTRLGFVATEVAWAGALTLAGEESGRLQCLDHALAPLPHPAGCLQLAAQLREARGVRVLATRGARGGPLVLAAFAGGPLALLQVLHPDLLTAWVRSGRAGHAVSLLRAADWARAGGAGLRALARLVGARGGEGEARAQAALAWVRSGRAGHAVSLLRAADWARAGGAGLRALARLVGARGGEGEARAQAALGAYLAPPAPHAAPAARYAPAVHDLARIFCHHLLRRGRIEKALSLCVDLAAWDLCCDARWAAARARLPALALEAAALAHPLPPAHPAHPAPDSVCSGSCSRSCSQCSSCSGSEDDRAPPLPRPGLPRAETVWNADVRDRPIRAQRWSEDNALDRPNRVVDVVPRPLDEKMAAVHFRHLFRTELRPEAGGARPRGGARVGEKNVKFSDTVTIAVVAAEPGACPQPARELADSLPLCAPHNYLAAFAPLPAHAPHGPHAAHAPPPGTALDYVEV